MPAVSDFSSAKKAYGSASEADIITDDLGSDRKGGGTIVKH